MCILQNPCLWTSIGPQTDQRWVFIRGTATIQKNGFLWLFGGQNMLPFYITMYHSIISHYISFNVYIHEECKETKHIKEVSLFYQRLKPKKNQQGAEWWCITMLTKAKHPTSKDLTAFLHFLWFSATNSPQWSHCGLIAFVMAFRAVCSVISTHLDTVRTAVKKANTSDGVEDGVSGVIQHVVGADWREGMALMEEENRHAFTYLRALCLRSLVVQLSLRTRAQIR